MAKIIRKRYDHLQNLGDDTQSLQNKLLNTSRVSLEGEFTDLGFSLTEKKLHALFDVFGGRNKLEFDGGAIACS